MNPKPTRGADLGLLAGGGASQSVVVICRSTYEPRGEGVAGRHMCTSTYRRVNSSRLLKLPSLH